MGWTANRSMLFLDPLLTYSGPCFGVWAPSRALLRANPPGFPRPGGSAVGGDRREDAATMCAALLEQVEREDDEVRG